MMDAKTMRMMVKSGRGEEAYALRVEELVRERYSVSAELAILRQREAKAEEFQAYNTFAEKCKAQAHREVYGDDPE